MRAEQEVREILNTTDLKKKYPKYAMSRWKFILKSFKKSFPGFTPKTHVRNFIEYVAWFNQNKTTRDKI